MWVTRSCVSSTLGCAARRVRSCCERMSSSKIEEASRRNSCRTLYELTLYELLVEGPLELDLSPRIKLRTLTVRVEGSNGGVRIEDIELEGRSISSLTDFLDVGGIYLNLLSLPLAYFVPSCTLPNQDEEKAVDDLSFWTPSEGVRVTDCDVSASRDGRALAAVRITRYEPETVELELEAPQAGYVVLADTYRPGWRVEVDEEPVAVLRAQHAQRAVAVSSGRHSIRFFYRPRSLYFGAALSLFGLIMILVCIFSASFPGKPHQVVDG